jgi:hypothetical protein
MKACGLVAEERERKLAGVKTQKKIPLAGR